MLKHTPGPWHRGAGNGEGSIFSASGRMRMEKGGTTLYPICTVTTGWDAAEDAGNAVLLAEAPTMAEALRDLCEWAERTGGWESPAWDRARALLRRVDGVPEPEPEALEA